MESSILIMSLNRNALQKFRTIRPGWKVGLLTAVAVGKLTMVDADFLAVNVNMATPRFVRSAHRKGKAVYVWTVNDPLTMSIMMGRGVNAIITDKPALAKSILAQRRQMSSLERLLVEASTLFGIRPKSNLTIDDF
jgi:glycerophosphoryl diester phosphodiesterase